MKKSRLLEIIREEITSILNENTINEMAKISGNLKSAIEKVIQDNPDLEGLALKKAIKADKVVEDALEGDTLYDNQLNKFIALTKGEREVGQRGRKADPNKPKPESKEPQQRGRKPSTEKTSSTQDMDDEDKEAMKADEKDKTAKALASTPEEKKGKI
jgi:hypothetical protein